MVFTLKNSSHIFFTCFLFLFSLLMATSAEAANPYGRYGWISPIASLDGDDMSCGTDELTLTLEVRDRDTDMPIVIQSAIVAVFDQSTNALLNVQNGVGPRIGPVCYNPDTHYIAFDVNGGAGYYNFYASYVDSTPEILPRQKSATSVIWVTAVGTPVEYEKVSPSPVDITIASSSPSYVYAVNHVHTAYGATGLSMIHFFVAEFDPLVSNYTNTVVSKVVAQSGGAGTKTISPETLADGWYGWGLYVRLNRDHDVGYGVLVNDVPVSGFVTTGLPFPLEMPFVLDTTPPEITNINNAPPSPTIDETVTIEVTATDSLTGVARVEVFVDGVLVNTCSYASVNTALCQTTIGSLTAGTHSYTTVVYDTAGNSRVGDATEFTVTAVPRSAPLSCEFPDSTILDTAQAWNGSWYAGLQAMKKVGNYVYAGGSGAADVEGLYIYDISDSENISQVSFFSTSNPESVRNNSWGNDVLSVEVVGQYAYLTTYRGGLVILDVSDPAAPLFVGKLALPNESWDVKIRGNFAYFASGNGLIIVNVSDKSNPALVSNLNLGGGISQDLVLSGNYAYIALRSDGVRVVDISNPNSPSLVASITDGYFPGYLTGSWAYSVDIKGNYLYVADTFQEKISVFNIYNPASPVLVRTVSVPGAAHPDSPRVFTVVQDVLYVGSGRYGLYVFDITDPSNPTELYNIGKPPILGGTVWYVLPINDNDFQRIIFVTEDINAALYSMEIECEQLPNLEAAVPSVTPDVVAPEGVITITAEIRNSGTVVAGPYNVQLFVDANGDGVDDYVLPAVVRIDSDTGIGMSQTIAVDWTVPATAPVSNNYRVGYFADINNEVDEGMGDHAYANWSGWSDPFTVALPSTPELSGSGCSVPLGDSECQGSISWNVSGATDPNLYNATTGNICSTEPIGVNENCQLQYGVNNIQLRSGTTILRNMTATANCEDGAWNDVTNQCVPLPDMPNIRIQTEKVVRSGTTTAMEIGITADYDVTCNVYGATSDSPREINHAASASEVTYTLISKTLNNTQIVRVDCTVLGIQVSESVRIQVESSQQEI